MAFKARRMRLAGWPAGRHTNDEHDRQIKAFREPTEVVHEEKPFGLNKTDMSEG